VVVPYLINQDYYVLNVKLLFDHWSNIYGKIFFVFLYLIFILYFFSSIKLTDDQVDGPHSLSSLIQRLQNDIGQIAFLGGCDLELLSDMDPDSLVDMAFDR